MAYQQICQITKCPEKTYGRLRDANNVVRRDLCFDHFTKTVEFYNKNRDKPLIFTVMIWGEKQ